MNSHSAQYAQADHYAHEINQYVRDELKGQYALLAGSHRTNKHGPMARRGRKGRPVWGWPVLAINALLR